MILDPTISFSQYRGDSSITHLKKNKNKFKISEDEEPIPEKSNEDDESKSLTDNDETSHETCEEDSENKVEVEESYHASSSENKEKIVTETNTIGKTIELNYETEEDKKPKISLLDKNVLSNSPIMYKENNGALFAPSLSTLNKDKHQSDSLSKIETKESSSKIDANNVESRIPKMIEAERQDILNNNSLMENSGITPSVSSSKYNLNVAQMAAARLILQKEVEAAQKPRRNRVFNINTLKERIKVDLLSFTNFTKSASYELLSCPHPPFVNMLNFKGQMFDP